MPKKIDPQLKERAVRLVLEHRAEYSSTTAAAAAVARQLGVGTESVRRWVVQARIDRGLVVGPTTEELAEIKALRKEVADQQRTIEILKAATTFFAQEADPRSR